MFTLSHSPRRPGNPMNRRSFLQVGALGLGGLTVADLLRLRAQAGTKRSPRSVIMIVLKGGPSHIDMYDLKPNAPAEIRGEFKPIRTCVPGFDICELMPRQAQIADKLALVRTIKFNDTSHDLSECYTGFTFRHQRPTFGSAISRFVGGPRDLPTYVGLSKAEAADRSNTWERAQYLGAGYGPMHVDGESDLDILNLAVTPERFKERHKLLQASDAIRSAMGKGTQPQEVDTFAAKATDIVTGTRAREAFDLSREPDRMRQRYDLSCSPLFTKRYGTWGPRFLLARRLIEAGVPVVTMRPCHHGWDAHSNIFPDLRMLLPVLDHCIHALVTDLHERGLDKEVLVVVWGEFGRTPQIYPRPEIGAAPGRHHHPPVGFALFAGAVRTGQVIGQTDSQAYWPKTRGLGPQNVLATIYEKLGIDPGLRVPDLLGRPTPLLDDAKPITELVT
jgi:hypothetical protein